jgi:hypothetical protein
MKGLSEFKTKTLESFPQVYNFWDIIERFILESEAPKIELSEIKFGLAVSFSHVVIFSSKVFEQTLPNFLFTVFHEFSHQYQFKKYGAKNMLKLYTKDISDDDGANLMKNIEIVADRLAHAKLIQIQKKGYLQNETLPKGIYNQIPYTTFVQTIQHLKSQVSDLGLKTSEEISLELYDWLKK